MSALANPVFVSVEEYLHSTFRPDCDYVDGVIEERFLGEYEHSAAQLFFGFLFRTNRDAWNARVFPEYRVQVSRTRYRVPDITVVRAETPRQSILRTPPLLIIEILSPKDTFSRLQQRVTDYLYFGVEHLWIIDPYNHLAYLADDRGFHEPEAGTNATLSIPGTPIAVALPDLWQELDSAPPELEEGLASE